MVNGEDLKIKAEREALSTLESQVLKESTILKRLDTRYKNVIIELRNQVKWYANNSHKVIFLKLINKLRKVVKL